MNELNSEKENEEPARAPLDHGSDQESDTPLFLRGSSDEKKGDAQDETDKMENNLSGL